ncbi:MAG: PhnD/SsuA/transferrin family substrate-binding protein [Pseudomonadota bacterium]
MSAAAGRISLPMYDFPPSQEANDAFVRALVAALPAGLADAERLVSSDVAQLWRGADLLLSQACGYPLMTGFREDVAYVATPHYSLPGCEGPRYCSVFLVAADSPAASLADLQGARVAINGRDSQSGHNCLRFAVAPLAQGKPFFSRVFETGRHLLSAAAVGSGEADLAAIDCVTHGLAMRDAPGRLAGTRVLGFSASAPGLPLVTAASATPETIAALRAGLDQVMADPSLAAVRKALALSGVSVLPAGAYQEILDMETAAADLGYAVLR